MIPHFKCFKILLGFESQIFIVVLDIWTPLHVCLRLHAGVSGAPVQVVAVPGPLESSPTFRPASDGPGYTTHTQHSEVVLCFIEVCN